MWPAKPKELPIPDLDARFCHLVDRTHNVKHRTTFFSGSKLLLQFITSRYFFVAGRIIIFRQMRWGSCLKCMAKNVRGQSLQAPWDPRWSLDHQVRNAVILSELYSMSSYSWSESVDGQGNTTIGGRCLRLARLNNDGRPRMSENPLRRWSPVKNWHLHSKNILFNY